MQTIKEEMTSQTTRLLQSKDEQHGAEMKQTKLEASDGLARAEEKRQAQVVELQRTLDTKTEELEKAIADLKEKHAQVRVRRVKAAMGDACIGLRILGLELKVYDLQVKAAEGDACNGAGRRRR